MFFSSAAGSCGTVHPGVELRANCKSISHRCHLFEVIFVWELTKETIHLPLGCLQGGSRHLKVDCTTIQFPHQVYAGWGSDIRIDNFCRVCSVPEGQDSPVT